MAVSRDPGRIYVVTDIEVDGFVPGAQPHPDTWAWWLSQPPEVLAAATEGARPVPEVMADFTAYDSSRWTRED